MSRSRPTRRHLADALLTAADGAPPAAAAERRPASPVAGPFGAPRERVASAGARLRTELLHLDGVRLAALGAFGFGLVVYVRTLLPGVAFGDWAEMQTAPYLLEVPHPTGFPLFVLVGRLWLFLEPFGSVAWRMNLFAAVVVSGAAAMAALTAARLGARPLLALVGAMTLVVTGTVWDAATVAEVNGLHLFLVSVLLFLAVRWRDEGRDRDLLLGALVGGLAISNHLLAVAALAILAPAVLWAGRRRLLRMPALVPAAAILVGVGLLPYLFIPIRVLLSGPTEYPALRTWKAIEDHVTGVVYRKQMDLFSTETLATIGRDLPALGGFAVNEITLVPLVVAAIGFVALALRDRWGALVTLGLFAITVDLFVGYRGDLPHYLLVAWLVVAIWAALGLEAILDGLERRAGPRARRWVAAVVPVALVIPITVASVNLPSHDLSGDTAPTRFVNDVLGMLPRDAILITYWDAGEAFHHAECVDHVRPDVDVIAPDDWVSFRPCTGLTADAAMRSGRPIFSLAYANRGLQSIAGRYVAEPITRLAVPYGGLALDHEATLMRIIPTR